MITNMNDVCFFNNISSNSCTIMIVVGGFLMIIYKSTKRDFVNDCKARRIGSVVKADFERCLGRSNKNEERAWDRSLLFMSAAIDGNEIEDECEVCVEYKFPNSGHRIDFIIAGRDEKDRNNVVIVELKQWESAEVNEDKKLVNTYLGGGNRDVAHPSYQAWSYAMTLENYNEALMDGDISLFPCSYLHSYVYLSDDKIKDSDIFPEINEAPCFTCNDLNELKAFIIQHVVKPSKDDIMERIDNGRIKPSKSLQDVIGSLLRGNREFILLDDQKVFFENIMAYVRRIALMSNEKNVFIISGGPGTGKSVLAINLLATSVREGHMAAYVSKNAAPRNVYEDILTKKDRMKRTKIHELFLGSGSFVGMSENTYEALFVDEAHRLNEKSGLFHKGENQIKEIINASRISVFFIDEAQRVTASDIGSVVEIKHWAKEMSAVIHEGKLTSQFRCNGSDGYISFLDDVLEISKEPYTFDNDDYDIEILDDPNDVMDRIKVLNKIDNKARVLAGYCWDWISKANGNGNDINIDEYNFHYQWNLNRTSTWAIDEDSVDQIGCIHTSQGLEFSYCGVIIGPDLRYENGRVITDYSKRAGTDKSLYGLIGPCRIGDELALEKVDAIIRNTYKTLLSRAMKGCFVYCTDSALSIYLKERIRENKELMESFKKSIKLG